MNKSFSKNSIWKENNDKREIFNLNGLSKDDGWVFDVELECSSWFGPGLILLLFNVDKDERGFEDLWVFFSKIAFDVSPISFVLQKQNKIKKIIENSFY